jgi:hypothetical protein
MRAWRSVRGRNRMWGREKGETHSWYTTEPTPYSSSDIQGPDNRGNIQRKGREREMFIAWNSTCKYSASEPVQTGDAKSEPTLKGRGLEQFKPQWQLYVPPALINNNYAFCRKCIKEWLFPQTAITDWSLSQRPVFFAVRIWIHVLFRRANVSGY